MRALQGVKCESKETTHVRHLTVGLTGMPPNPEKHWTETPSLCSQGPSVCVICLLKGAWSKLLLNWESKHFS